MIGSGNVLDKSVVLTDALDRLRGGTLRMALCWNWYTAAFERRRPVRA